MSHNIYYGTFSQMRKAFGEKKSSQIVENHMKYLTSIVWELYTLSSTIQCNSTTQSFCFLGRRPLPRSHEYSRNRLESSIHTYGILPAFQYFHTYIFNQLGLFAPRCAQCTRLSTAINKLKKTYEISVTRFDPFQRSFIDK